MLRRQRRGRRGVDGSVEMDAGGGVDDEGGVDVDDSFLFPFFSWSLLLLAISAQ